MSIPPPLPGAPATPLPTPPQRRGWWQRHWRWAVPLLVLMGLSIAAMLIYGFITMLGAAMRDNDAYQIAMAQAAGDPRLVEAIGSPIEHDGFMSGHVSTGTHSSAALQIPVAGPRGEAKVFVEAESRLGVWKFAVLSATVDGAETSIDLLPSLPETRRLRADAAEDAGDAGDGDAP